MTSVRTEEHSSSYLHILYLKGPFYLLVMFFNACREVYWPLSKLCGLKCVSVTVLHYIWEELKKSVSLSLGVDCDHAAAQGSCFLHRGHFLLTGSLQGRALTARILYAWVSDGFLLTVVQIMILRCWKLPVTGPFHSRWSLETLLLS